MRTLLFALCTAGCGISTATTAINAPPHPMYVHPGALDVFASAPPTRSHVDVSLIRVASSTLWPASDADLFAALRARAVELGCDALMVTGMFGRARLEGLIGTCAAYVDGPPGATPSRSAAR